MNITTLLPWFSLVGAALCQTAWTLSLKLLRWSDLTTSQWPSAVGPLLGYVGFGVVNTILLAVAMRTLALTTAFAVWTALTLVFIKLVDVIWLQSGWSWAELFFLLLIGIGIIGLKVVAPAS
jgi:quaternary ammonium compound-resistance protein SugE